MEENTVNEDGTSITQYKGTIWADSMYAALHKLNITELADEPRSDYELANMLLANVTSDSLSNLMQKLTEWSRIREEDPSL